MGKVGMTVFVRAALNRFYAADCSCVGPVVRTSKLFHSRDPPRLHGRSLDRRSIARIFQTRFRPSEEGGCVDSSLPHFDAAVKEIRLV